MCEQAGSEDPNIAVSAYINMWSILSFVKYMSQIREIPAQVFSLLDKESSLKKATDFIEKLPTICLRLLMFPQERLKKTLIEPPLEKAADFREFVKSCENYISSYLTK